MTSAAWLELAARHHSDHRALLPHLPSSPEHRPDPAERTRIEAVVVPAYRPAAGLSHAIDVAATTGAPLVLLCSGPATIGAVLRRVRERDRSVTAVAIDAARHRSKVLEFETDSHEHGTFLRRHDANTKRNLALLLARLMGWDRVMLLNDDVRGLTSVKLRRACTQLDRLGAKLSGDRRFAAVGWSFTEYPDNSVVCHADRVLDGAQKTFVSDGALIFDVSPRMGYFPAVYNEDWLFLFDALRRGSVAMANSELHQLPYDPFVDPRRAQAEEFGDLLGEGLLGLLHEPASADDEFSLKSLGDTMVNPDYWRIVLLRRQDFIRNLLWRLEERDRSSVPRRRMMKQSLEAALARHDADWPASLASWIRDWRRDIDRWQERLACAEPVVGGATGGESEVKRLELALRLLGIRDACRLLLADSPVARQSLPPKARRSPRGDEGSATRRSVPAVPVAVDGDPASARDPRRPGVDTVRALAHVVVAADPSTAPVVEPDAASLPERRLVAAAPHHVDDA